MATSNSSRAIDSFLEYFQGAKPYHTKLLEVIEEYRFFEEMYVCTCEDLVKDITIINTPLCKETGFGLDYDDNCGYDAIDCCDLFDCDGGYGYIFDNSDLLVDKPITSINETAVSVGVSGNQIPDTRIPVGEIINSNTAVLKGDATDLLNKHSIFLYVNVLQFEVVSNIGDTIILDGNQVDFIETKDNFRIEGSETRYNGHYTIRSVSYDPVEDKTSIKFVFHTVTIPDDALLGVKLQFRNSNPNVGIYQVDSFSFDGINTLVQVSGNSFNHTAITDEMLGSFQFRTGLRHFREIDIIEQEDNYHTILYTEYNYPTNETILYLDGDVSSYDIGVDTVKLFGYFYGSGFDGEEECSKTKDTHIYSLLEEQLLIEINDDLINTTPVAPSSTPTPTPSISESATPTPTPTPTPSISESATPTPTPSISESITPTPTPTPTPSNASSTINISGASFDNKVLSLSLVGEEDTPQGMTFSPDGTKGFIVGAGGDGIFQYTVGSSNNISTWEYDEAFLSTLDATADPQDIIFSPNGDKMFILSFGRIYQFSVIDSNDLTTWSYDQESLNIFPPEGSATGMVFSPDGTKLFVIGFSSDSIHQFSTTNPSDMSTWSYDNLSLSISGNDSIPSTLAFSSNNNKVFVGGRSTDSIFQYSYSDANDITTWVDDGISISLQNRIGDIFNLMFSPDDSKLFVLGRNANVAIDTIFQYTFPLSNNITDLIYDNVAFTAGAVSNNAEGIILSPDQTKMFLVDRGLRAILQFSVPDINNVETWTYDNLFIEIVETQARTIRFSPDKSKLFVLGLGGKRVDQYTVSNPNDVTTWSYDNVSFSLSTQTEDPYDLAFSSDGSKVYILERNLSFGNTRRILQYSSPDPNDVTTWGYDSKTFSFTAQDDFPSSIYITANGEKLFMLGLVSDQIHQYSTIDDNDVDTWIYDNVVFTIPTGTSGNLNGLMFTSDETKFFIVDNLNGKDNIEQYSVF